MPESRHLRQAERAAFFSQGSNRNNAPANPFYPDFVATLNDGRVLIVEYKGADQLGSPDTNEKTTIGQIYEACSKGRCLFQLVGKADFESQILDAIHTKS